jgi:hypothetical protein
VQHAQSSTHKTIMPEEGPPASHQLSDEVHLCAGGQHVMC